MHVKDNIEVEISNCGLVFLFTIVDENIEKKLKNIKTTIVKWLYKIMLFTETSSLWSC